MENKLKHFLDSDLLYKYLVEETSDTETAEVEHYITKYPEAASAYEELENNLEILAHKDAQEAPNNILDNALQTINTTNSPKVVRLVNWYTITSSAAAVIFAISSVFLYKSNLELNEENNVIVEEIYDLRKDRQKDNSKLRQIKKLNDPDALKYVLSGNERAENLKTVAYINPVKKTSVIDIVALPQLPEEQYYKIWAEVEDNIIGLGILDETQQDLKQIPYIEDAVALSITIENENDVVTSKPNTEVAEITIK